jgi:NAD(P)-dependent dehydrogenase (short-subunit alcohol dehydrogenase family)
VKRILILGGYGGFGARLSRALAADGHRVLVAGRRLAKAQAFCADVANAEAVAADRAGDIPALLVATGPDLVIDAAGPFQESGYQVPRACIAARISYLDLADARAFVRDIAALDAAARAAGVSVVSGASSVPALSGAVIRELMGSLDRACAIDIAISAGARGRAGASVTAAILSYVGKPVRLWRGRKWRALRGWRDLKRQRFDRAGGLGFTRLVALADVPDHDLGPSMIAGRPAVTFRAGPEFAFQTLALWLLSWLVSCGWMASLTPIAGPLRSIQGLTSWLGGGRSAMTVEVAGFAGDMVGVRRWTLVAERGDGPNIPAMPAVILARMILAGELPPGAGAASGLLTLNQFEPLFAPFAIRHHITEHWRPPLYAKIMDAAFDRLPAAVRAMHQLSGDGGAHGAADVIRGRSPLAHLIAAAMGFPPAGTHQLHVAFGERDGVERWTRDFAGARFTSHLSERRGRLVERFGPLRFAFDLPGDDRGLTMVMRGWSVFNIPFPLAMAPRTRARESQDGEDFRFDVRVSLPLVGLIVEYRGRLRKM